MCSDLCCDFLANPPTYQDFFRSYLLPNRPVILGPSLVATWPAFREWLVHFVTPSTAATASPPEPGSPSDHNVQIDWDYLIERYGNCQVTVADCDTRDFTDQKRETMAFHEVVALWRSGLGSSLYIKDWHLTREIHQRQAMEKDAKPELFYSTPDIFQDDWMNAYYSACTDDDFRFVYVGAAGTFTPLHRDVYTSYSWSTNVYGRKRWWLFPPEQTEHLFRKGREEHMETVYDVRDVNPDEYPGFVQAQPIVVEQKAGETIFVPSGWYHQVENLTTCISINHNWCNAVNLPSLYAAMCAKVAEVERALEDVRELLSQRKNIVRSAPTGAPREGDGGEETRDSESDGWKHEWVQIVQDVVEKDAGWNWLTFWRMVLHALRGACVKVPSLALDAIYFFDRPLNSPPADVVGQ
ncbi:hypothetical protein AcV7_007480 [Taiwanofungus camphoratus]|nr:hypothetical protein AcV7_007480 [Antrodia cinnamomea]